MSQPIEVEYVELRASGTNETVRDVKRALRDIERDVDSAGSGIESSFSESFAAIEQQLTKIGSILTKEATAQRNAWKRVAKQLGDDISTGAGVATRAIDSFAGEVSRDMNGIKRDVRRASSELTHLGDESGGLGGVRKLGNAFTSLGSFLVQPLALIGKSPLVLAAMAAAVALATPVIIALGGALVDLAGAALALPAGIGVLAAVIAPLIVSFQGLGDAVSALASGDLEKIDKAMKNLAPSARTFAREIDALRKPFGQLRKDVQQEFFKPLIGDLTRLANAVLPTLRTGMRDVSRSLGEFGSKLFELLGSQDTIESIGDAFETTGRIIRNITPSAIELIGTLFRVMERGLPFVERAFGALDRGLQKITDFLGGSLEDGSFEQFIEDAFATMSDLGDLAGSVFSLLGTLFGDAGDEGRTFIQSLTGAVDKLNEFFKSAEGQQALQDSLDTVKDIGNAILVLVDILITGAQWFQRTKDAVSNFASTVGDAIDDIGGFFSGLGRWVSDVGTSAGNFFTRIGEFFSNIGGKVVEAWNTLSTFFNNAVTFFTQLPGQIVAALHAIPELLTNAFQQAFDAVFYVIGFALGTVVRFFIELPGRISAAAVQVRDFLINTWNTTRDFVVTTVSNLVERVITFFINLPGRIQSAISSLIERVSSTFILVRDGVVSTTLNLVNRAVEILRSLPEKAQDAVVSLPDKILSVLRGIVTSAYNIGRDIINGVKNGIGSAIDGAIEAAKRAARQIVKGFTDALKIGSPSKVLADEVGKPIPAGVEVGVKAATPQMLRTINTFVASGISDAATPDRTGANSTLSALNQLTSENIPQSTTSQNSAVAQTLTQTATSTELPQFDVYVMIGDEQLERATVKVVRRENRAVARAVTYQPRTV